MKQAYLWRRRCNKGGPLRASPGCLFVLLPGGVSAVQGTADILGSRSGFVLETVIPSRLQTEYDNSVLKS